MKMPHARRMMSGVLALSVLIAFQVALFWLMQFDIPHGNENLVTFMLGQLSGFAGAAITFYLGNTEAAARVVENEPPAQIIEERIDNPEDQT